MIKVKKVPEDGNCIFWATMMAYLEPVKADKTKFQERYQNLFKKLEKWKNLFNYFNNENGDIRDFKDLMLLFRENIINYMQENINKEQEESLITLLPYFNDENRNILNAYEIEDIRNLGQYYDVVKKDGVFVNQIELVYISEFLKHNIIIFTDGNRNQKLEINENFKFKEEIEIDYVNGNHYNYFIETFEYDSGYDSKLDNGSDKPEKELDDVLNNSNPINNINSPQEISIPNDILTNKNELGEKKKKLENLQEEIETNKKTLQQLNAQVKLLQKNQSSKNNEKIQKFYDNLKIINFTNMKRAKELENIIINNNETIEKLEEEIKNKNLVIEAKEKSAKWWKKRYEEYKSNFESKSNTNADEEIFYDAENDLATAYDYKLIINYNSILKPSNHAKQPKTKNTNDTKNNPIVLQKVKKCIWNIQQNNGSDNKINKEIILENEENYVLENLIKQYKNIIIIFDKNTKNFKEAFIVDNQGNKKNISIDKIETVKFLEKIFKKVTKVLNQTLNDFNAEEVNDLVKQKTYSNSNNNKSKNSHCVTRV